MGINEELSGIKALLNEASVEIISKINELEGQIPESTVDPALLSDVKALAASLANIVPNAPVAPPAVEDVEDVEVPVGEVPELTFDDVVREAQDEVKE